MVRKRNSTQFFYKQRGFTLIELLVVIAIIAVLASLLMANFIGVRARGRDAQRKSTMRQIQSALEFYRSDNGAYPDPDDPTTGNDFPTTCNGSLDNALGTIYMQKVQCDPQESDLSSTPYDYTSDGDVYCMRGCLENTNDAEKDTTNNGVIANCPSLPNCSAGTVSFTLQNP